MAGIENNIVFGGGFKLQTSSARDISDMQRLSTDISTVNYPGDPNGNVSANPSSISHDRTTGNLYVKSTGTGNTGWTLIPTSGGGGVAGTNAFLAYLSGSTGNVTGDGTFVTPPFDTTTINNGSNFDTTNFWYLVPDTGIYQFMINAIFSNTGGTNTGLFLVLANSSGQSYFLSYNQIYNLAGGSGTSNGSIIIPCTAGDIISVQLAVTGNATKNVAIAGANVSNTSFSGYRVA
jgi:hypothetical protein